MILARVFHPVPEDPSFAMSYTLHFVKNAGDATERARAVLLLLVSAAVVTFGAYWNADHSFLDQRIDLVNAALAKGPSRAADCKTTIGTEHVRCLQVADVWKRLRASAAQGATVGDSTLKQLLTQDSTQLSTRRADAVRTMKMPVVDMTFDVRDLWLYTELAFVLLMIALTYAVVCERRDVALAFAAAGRVGARRICYELLASKQVLTVPASSRVWGKPIWRSLPHFLYWFPVIALAYGSLGLRKQADRSVDGVSDISPGSILLHGTLFIVTLVLTLTVHGLEHYYNREWTKYAIRAGVLKRSREATVSA